MDVTVRENPDAHRYEAVDDGGIVAGYVEYVDHRGTRFLFHTQVADEFEGRGVGSTLAGDVLEQALTGDQSVRVTCPFLTSWVERHPEYADKVTLG
jgi:predicted GNAT family acetyltransferase